MRRGLSGGGISVFKKLFKLNLESVVVRDDFAADFSEKYHVGGGGVVWCGGVGCQLYIFF